MKDLKKLQCFIAIVPGLEICKEVKVLQKYALENFKSGKAMNAPPHITLEPPMDVELDQLPALEKCLQSFAEKQNPVQIELKNFGAFKPRVIFIDVVENPKLRQLQGELQSCIRSDLELESNRPDRPFYPHMTIAFRDLRKGMFPEAWGYFSGIDYQRRFIASQLCLLQHNGKFWEKHQCYVFPK